MMGYNATGSLEQNDSSVDMKNYGLYYMAARDVFELAQEVEFQHMSISISLFEIYGGKLFDLLNERNQVKCLEDHKGKVNFPGLSEHAVSNADEVMQVIEDGACNRSTGTTSKNSDSSRSHAVLQVHVRKPGRRSNSVEHGRLTFIDLAGSERGADTATASRATRLEGAEINTSLLSLKEVIRALATGDSMAHIPFRGSKLTQVLKESFVGKNCSSVMVACIAPSMSNCEHTLNTLRYADRVKERNSTTGALSSSMATRPRDVNKSSLESGWNAPQRSTESMPVDDLLGRELDDALDEALDDALEDDPDLLDEGEDEKEPPFSSQRRRKPLQELVRTHRTIMSEMLVMCKDEMNLANNADVDRESMHSYLDELSKMHEKQCTMLTSLHEKLLEYRGHCGYSLSDDSYEDLRVD
jgi:kinesin family protein 2/24